MKMRRSTEDAPQAAADDTVIGRRAFMRAGAGLLASVAPSASWIARRRSRRDVRSLKTVDGDIVAVDEAAFKELTHRFKGDLLADGLPDYDDGPAHLECSDRPATRFDRTLPGRRRHRPCHALRRTTQCVGFRPWWWPQRRRLRDLRWRTGHRPDRTQEGGGRAAQQDRQGWRWRDLRRLRRRHPGIRVGLDRPDHLDGWHRGLHAGRRRRLVASQARTGLRQPRLRTGRDGRWQNRRGFPGPSRRPVLGAPRRRREFGIVSSFEFRLAPVSRVLAGLIVHPLEALPEVAALIRDFNAHAPDDVSVWLMLRKAPAAAALPRAIHGRPIVAIAVCYAGSAEDGERVVRQLRQFGRPLVDQIRVRSYADWQQSLDPAWGPGFGNQWLGHYLPEFSDASARTMLEHVANVSSPFTDVKLVTLGGAMARVGEGETAFSYRTSKYALAIQTRWADVRSVSRASRMEPRLLRGHEGSWQRQGVRELHGRRGRTTRHGCLRAAHVQTIASDQSGL